MIALSSGRYGDVRQVLSKNQKDGRVLIKTEANEEKLMIHVTNNGKGIPESELVKIFDFFYHPAGRYWKGFGIISFL